MENVTYLDEITRRDSHTPKGKGTDFRTPRQPSYDEDDMTLVEVIKKLYAHNKELMGKVKAQDAELKKKQRYLDDLHGLRADTKNLLQRLAECEWDMED